MARWYLGGEHWRISRGLEEIFKRAGIKTSIKIEGRKTATPDATFHSLRHTFVSFAVNGGVPLPVVQSIVGHSSNAMTRHYYHENEEVLRKAIAAIPSVGVGDEVKVEGEDEQRRRGIPAACKEFESRDRNVASPLGEESESRDNYVASPLAVTLPRREVTPGTMSGCSPLTAEMLGELRKMYEVLREVFG